MYYASPLALTLLGGGGNQRCISTDVHSCLFNMRVLRAYRRELIGRAQAPRIHRMFGRLGVSLSRYLWCIRPGPSMSGGTFTIGADRVFV